MDGFQRTAGGDQRLAVVTTADLAEYLCVSPQHVRRMDKAGLIPRPFRIGRSVRWVLREINAWMMVGGPDRQTWELRKALQQVAETDDDSPREGECLDGRVLTA